jgi:hypothetical protein
MANILHFPQFDEALQVATRAALEIAATEIGKKGQQHDVRKIIAARILRGARMGERDVQALLEIGMNHKRCQPLERHV